MPFIVTIAGSTTVRSRSTALLGGLAQVLRENGARVASYGLRDFSADALVYADFRNDAIRRFQADVAQANGVIVATPVYKAAYSGGLKLLLDLLPERSLASAAVLPIATGGSAAHLLAIDYALRPVLTSLKARHVLDGVYAVDSELSWDAEGALRVEPDTRARLQAALVQFISHLPRPQSADVDCSRLFPEERLQVAQALRRAQELPAREEALPSQAEAITN